MRKRYIPILLTAICLPILTGSCSNEENDTESHTEKILLHPDFHLAAENGADNARAIINGTSITEAVSVYLSKKNDNTPYPGGNNNGKYTFTYNGNWSCNENIYLYSETANIHAFYPAALQVSNQSDGNHTVPVTIPATQTFDGKSETATDATDYLYGRSGSDSQSGLVTADNSGNKSSVEKSIYLHHALSKVVFKLQYAQSRIPDANNDYVKSISLKSGQYLTGTGTMQINNGTLSLSSAGTLIFQAKGNSEIAPGDNGTPVIVAYGLTAPCASPGAVTLSVTLGARNTTNNDRTFSVSSEQFRIAWEAGKVYTYHLTLDNVGIGIQSETTINEWNAAGNSENIPPEGFALKVKAEIGGNTQSRATASGSAVFDRNRFYENDKILITQYRNGKTTQASYQKETNGEWKPETNNGQLYVQPETNYIGQYPVGYNGILPDQSDTEKFRLSNLLQTKEITPNDQWLNFTGENAFTHANCRVTFKFKLNKASLSTPTMHISSPGLYSGSAATDETVTFLNEKTVGTMESGIDQQYTAIIAPLAAGSDLSVTFTVDGITYSTSQACARVKNTHYTYTLDIQNDILVPLSEEITDWKNGGSINGDLSEL